MDKKEIFRLFNENKKELCINETLTLAEQNFIMSTMNGLFMAIQKQED